LSVAPALRHASGVTPASPGLGSRSHSHATRRSDSLDNRRKARHGAPVHKSAAAGLAILAAV
jgi:hypothetical protein